MHLETGQVCESICNRITGRQYINSDTSEYHTHCHIAVHQSTPTTNLRAQHKSQSAERTYDLVIMEMCPEPHRTMHSAEDILDDV